MYPQCKLEDIVAALREGRKGGKGAVFLTGGGCSVKAGIPTPAGMVEHIRNLYPAVYEKSSSKTYLQLVALLSPEEQTRLYDTVLKQTRVNWAHIAMALMMRDGYIDRVLTTNFDTILRQACNMIGLYAPIYDPTPAQVVKFDSLPPGSILCLHGQKPMTAGTLRLKSAAYWDGIGALLKESVRGRPVVVVGYSGEGDPVFEQLAKAGKFDQRLFWVGYLDQPPQPHLLNALLSEQRGSAYLSGFEADTFFVTVAGQLGLLPPEFLTHPLACAERAVASIAPFPIPGQSEQVDVTGMARLQLQMASRQWDAGSAPGAPAPAEDIPPETRRMIAEVQMHFMAGRYEQVLNYFPQHQKAPTPQMAQLLVSACVIQGKNLAERAALAGGEDRFQAFAKAAECFEQAVALYPDSPRALYLWGVSLRERAALRKGEEAELLLGQAAEKFQKTVKLHPDDAQAYFEWGCVLADRGHLKSQSEKAIAFYSQAAEKFQSALKAKGNMPEAYARLTEVLYALSLKKSGAEAARLLETTAEVCNNALALLPDNPGILCRLGWINLERAKSRTGKEADTLMLKAVELFQRLLHKHEDPSAQLGWAMVLVERGRSQPRELKIKLLEQAAEKFAAAAPRLGDSAELLLGWGSALAELAALKPAPAQLFQEAENKLKSVLRTRPDSDEAVYRLGVLLVRKAETQTAEETAAIYTEAERFFTDAVGLNPGNYTAHLEWANALLRLADLRPQQRDALMARAEEKLTAAARIRPDDGHEARYQLGGLYIRRAESAEPAKNAILFTAAVEHYRAALAIKPEYPDALKHWGKWLFDSAKGKPAEEADRILKQAEEKFQAATKILPDAADTLLAWGQLQLEQARLRRNPNAHAVYAEAKKKLQRAEELNPGCAAYAMARLMGALSDESACRQWLEKCRDQGRLPARAELKSDSCLDSVRESKWFKQIVEAAPGAKAETGNAQKS